MYRPPSPFIDVTDIPLPRRVKPLPKRRRTSEPTPADDGTALPSAGPTAHPDGADGQQQQQDHHPGIDDPEDAAAATAAAPPDPTDPTLAAQLALQAYYMPVLGGVPDLFKPLAGARTSPPISIDLSAALAGMGTGTGLFGSGAAYVGGGAGGGGGAGVGGLGLGLGGRAGPGSVGSTAGDDEDGTDGDYVDHLQQPGNTKKRKVPANMFGLGHGHDTGSGAEDEGGDRGIPTGMDRDADSVGSGAGGIGGGGGGGGGLSLYGGRNGYLLGLLGKKSRPSRATLAGLQHKEVLKSRKRQLAAVLGTLAHGDTLALDQALSASSLFLQSLVDSRNIAMLRVRPSQRRIPRLARALKAYKESHPQTGKDEENDENTAPPTSDFTFVSHCATSDRLVATTEEVANLHSRFEAELARQAAKAVEAAKQAQAALSAPLAKRTDRSKQASRTAGAKNTNDGKGAAEPSLLGGSAKGKGGKKKKRSALANASNPHHLRNYVPSRLPHTGGPPSTQQAAQNAQNLLTPLPLRFLSAEIPPRRRKTSEANVTPVSSTLTNPTDEWICPFCEYELFYGDEQSYARAVRNRKKILRRRRRARERAAAAASGVAPAAGTDRAENEEVHSGFESAAAAGKAESVSAGSKQAKWKEGDGGGQAAVAGHA